MKRSSFPGWKSRREQLPCSRPRRSASGIVLGVLLVLGGCGDDDDSGGGQSATTRSTTAGTAGDGNGSTGASTAGGTAQSGTGSGGQTGSAGTAGTTASDSTGQAGQTGSSTGAAMMCDPDAQTDPCAACVEENCCEQSLACLADPGCTCFQECAAQADTILERLGCADDCDVSLQEGITGDVVSCTVGSCAAECPVT